MQHFKDQHTLQSGPSLEENPFQKGIERYLGASDFVAKQKKVVFELVALREAIKTVSPAQLAYGILKDTVRSVYVKAAHRLSLGKA